MNVFGAERRGWSLTWLVLIVAVVVALPAMIFSPLVLISLLCLFLAGIGLARRRFTPGLLTVLVATVTVFFGSTLGEAIFDRGRLSRLAEAGAMIPVSATARHRVPWAALGACVVLALGSADAATDDCFRGDIREQATLLVYDGAPNAGGVIRSQEPQCRSVGDFVLDMVFSGNGEGADSPSLVAKGRIARVDGLPPVLFERVFVQAEFAIEERFLFPRDGATTGTTLSLRSDLFEWPGSGASRYVFRHVILPYMVAEANELAQRVAALDAQYPGFGEHDRMRSPLVATRDWIVSNYPPGTADWLSADGAELRQPRTAEGYDSLTVLHGGGGGFFDRGGALKVGESYLVAFRKGSVDGGAYRIRDVPRWTVFWGEEMDRLVEALRSLTQCARERTGLPMHTDAEGFEQVRPTLANCFDDLWHGRSRASDEGRGR